MVGQRREEGWEQQVVLLYSKTSAWILDGKMVQMRATLAEIKSGRV
jgi:hypothetical protein